MTNEAKITRAGAGPQIIDFGGHNILANFAANATGASFTLQRSFATAGNFTNNGNLTVNGLSINGTEHFAISYSGPAPS